MSTTRKSRAETRRLQALVSSGHWLRPRFQHGQALDDGRFLAFLAEVCAPWRPYYIRLPQTQEDAQQDGFFLDNSWFGAVDAEVLYCVVRTFQPRTVVEVGSGYSTRLMRRAIGDGQLFTRLRCIDPEPRVDIFHYADEHVRRPVEQLEPSQLAESLNPGDILFIDSSHTIKTGGDVPYLFLEIVPRLRPGVLVHVHDTFLPFEYPQEWVVAQRCEWNEQYLVQALLYGNECVEILWPAHYMWMLHRRELLEVIPSDTSGVGPSSLWFRKLV